ncbi:unnamed protein product [Anisakis simplex]|uniref:WD repeat-containing protein 89 n=1 Tax=Anisakis simplex TaxID=6269 RepID=A0A158PP09_ANISI|nr:unnamed protein product [Anisakis simplex]
MTSDCLFIWSSPLQTKQSWYVNNVSMCGVRGVIASLTDGYQAKLVSVDTGTGKTAAKWNQMSSTTIVSMDYSHTKQVSFAFDKDGGIWQLDLRSNDICQNRSSMFPNESAENCVHYGTISNDGHSIAIALTFANEPTKATNKKKKKRQGGGDQSSDSDVESVEPFTHSVQLWDARNMASCLHSYNQIHNDDIQSLTFSSDQPHLLASGGADGLVNVFDSRIVNEDDALQSTIPMESSVNRVGFLSSNRAFAITDDNCFSLLRINSADDIDVISRKKQPFNGKFIVDILDCDQSDCFYVMESSGEGHATVHMVTNNGSEISVVREYSVHKDLVRCVDYDLNQRLMVSGGDDARIVGCELLPPNTDLFVAKSKPKMKGSSLKRKPYAR